MFVLLLTILTSDLLVKNTGIFNQVNFLDVHISSGQIFILAKKDRKIYRYNKSDGRLLGKMSGPGLGPGELEFPIIFFGDNDFLYVKDGKQIEVFLLNGTFHTSYRIPKHAAGYIQKVNEGWLENSNVFSSRLVYFSEDFQRSQIVIPEEYVFKNDIRRDGFDPTISTLSPLVTKDGQHAFFVHPKNFRIDIYRIGEDFAMSGSVTRNFKPRAINVKWARQKLKELENGIKRYQPNVRIRENFPKTMSLIRWKQITPEGFIGVRLWGKHPEMDNGPFLVFDTAGNEAKSVCTDSESLQRVVGFHGEKLLVLAYPDEEVAIGLVSPEGLSEFFRKFPMRIRHR